VDNWLVGYSVQNGDIHQALRNLSIDLSELENELFSIKIWNEINVAPLRSYIEEFVETELKRVADERQQKRHQQANRKNADMYHRCKSILMTSCFVYQSSYSTFSE
jgi:hypothetical protein